MLDLNPYKKGSVFFTKIPHVPDDLPLMQRRRPVVIVNAINTSYGKVLVAPVTSKPNKNGVHVTLEDGVDSTVLVDYIFPIYVKSLHTYLGSLSDEKIKEIDRAIGIFMGTIESSEEDIKKYFPNQSIYNVEIKMTSDYSIPVSTIRSPVTSDYSKIEVIEDKPEEILEVHTQEVEPEIKAPAKPKPTPAPKKKRVKLPSFNNISRKELEWFANSKPEDIIARYGCCKGTATKKKRQAKEKLRK